MASNIRLLVGLVNPGPEYSQTRHNAGGWLVQALADAHHTSFKPESKFFGHTARISLQGQDLRLLIPSTFMNLSGKAIAAVANFYQIAPEEIMVAHDELDLDPGVARFKQGGGHGGHNGLRDSISKLGNNKNFHRCRIGIGHPGHKDKVTGYVLGRAPSNDQILIDAAINEAVCSFDILIQDGLPKAMNRLHSFNANKS